MGVVTQELSGSAPTLFLSPPSLLPSSRPYAKRWLVETETLTGVHGFENRKHKLSETYMLQNVVSKWSNCNHFSS